MVETIYFYIIENVQADDLRRNLEASKYEKKNIDLLATVDCSSTCTLLTQSNSVSKGKLAASPIILSDATSMKISFQFNIAAGTPNANLNILDFISTTTGKSMISIGFTQAGIIYQTYMKYNDQYLFLYGPFATANTNNQFTLTMNFVTGQYSFSVSGSWSVTNTNLAVLGVNPNGQYSLYTSSPYDTSSRGTITNLKSKYQSLFKIFCYCETNFLFFSYNS